MLISGHPGAALVDRRYRFMRNFTNGFPLTVFNCWRLILMRMPGMLKTFLRFIP